MQDLRTQVSKRFWGWDARKPRDGQAQKLQFTIQFTPMQFTLVTLVVTGILITEFWGHSLGFGIFSSNSGHQNVMLALWNAATKLKICLDINCRGGCMPPGHKTRCGYPRLAANNDKNNKQYSQMTERNCSRVVKYGDVQYERHPLCRCSARFMVENTICKCCHNKIQRDCFRFHCAGLVADFDYK